MMKLFIHDHRAFREHLFSARLAFERGEHPIEQWPRIRNAILIKHRPPRWIREIVLMCVDPRSQATKVALDTLPEESLRGAFWAVAAGSLLLLGAAVRLLWGVQ